MTQPVISKLLLLWQKSSLRGEHFSTNAEKLVACGGAQKTVWSTETTLLGQPVMCAAKSFHLPEHKKIRYKSEQNPSCFLHTERERMKLEMLLQTFARCPKCGRLLGTTSQTSTNEFSSDKGLTPRCVWLHLGTSTAVLLELSLNLNHSFHIPHLFWSE